MKIAGRYIETILLIFAFTFLIGCGYTKEEKALMKSYEKNAKKNAENYIEEKYGFQAEITGTKVLKVDPGPVPDFSPSPTGMVNVSMKYAGVDFTVNITGEDESTEGKDDYQKPEIEKAFKDRLESELEIRIETIDAIYWGDCLIADKFTDIDSFLKDAKGHSVVSISVKTFDPVSDRTVANVSYDTIELLVISCRNEAALNILSDLEYIKEHSYRMNFYNQEALDNKLAEYSLFMNGYVFKSIVGKVTSRCYEFEKVEDSVFLVYDNQSSVKAPKVTETDKMAPERDWSRDSGKVKTYPTFENPKRKSKTYAVDFGDLDRVQIFMRQEEKKDDDKAQRYIALQYTDEEGNEVLTHISPRTIEDSLYSFMLERQEDMKFVVMINQR